MARRRTWCVYSRHDLDTKEPVSGLGPVSFADMRRVVQPVEAVWWAKAGNHPRDLVGYLEVLFGRERRQ